MDTKLTNYSHSLITKIIVFMIVIGCFTGVITTFLKTVEPYNSFEIVLEDSYFKSRDFMNNSEDIINALTRLIVDYKSEEHILNGGTIDESEIAREEKSLFVEFEAESKNHNPKLSYEENYEIFKEEYSNRLLQIRNRLINQDLKDYNFYLSKLNEYKNIKYYVSDGQNKFTNSSDTRNEYFKSFPSYMIFDDFNQHVYPREIVNNRYYYWITARTNELYNAQARTDSNELVEQENLSMYVAFTDEFLNSRAQSWMESKSIITNSLYKVLGFLLGLIISFVYLVVIIGKKSFRDKEVHLNSFDKLYNDINIAICITLIAFWFVFMEGIYVNDYYSLILPVTLVIGAIGLIFVLSLIKHIKNKTFFKHTLTFTIFHKLFMFIKDIYDGGSVTVKVALVVIGYPLIVALTFFMFPVTIGVGVWLATKKVKEFNAIKAGVEKIKNGDIHHTIELEGKGEFASLASNINSIADGLNKAVDNEVKSQRLKTELITNVSHDIRTPLTSIITYVDLLKQEEDKEKAKEYIEILDQKSQRLKTLTDDLFEASKASSGDIPVNYEKIDIVSLITQGLGELNDKIEESQLKFKLNHPNDKVYVMADGKLLWRSIENLLSNIFKYALKGSRVYIDIDDLGNEVKITMKNISAYELNISADELMERFKRGDESRTSQGSGLGLSIARSLINIQKGSFDIEIDGDLFKAIIEIPKYQI